MRRAIVLLLALCVAASFSFLGTAVAAEQPGKIVLNQGGKKGPVHFDHKAHVARAANCKECHHKDSSGAEQKCSACHKEKQNGNIVSAKEAFHTDCKDCHKTKGGPTKCNECHKK